MTALCLIPDCGRRATSRGYCKTHYSRLQRNGDPLVLVRKLYKGQPCSIPGCAKSAYCQGMCITHYARTKKHGSPHVLWPKVAPNGTRALDKNGYVRIKMKGHPNANPGGWVNEHVYVMTQMLGRPLIAGESVHHKNGVRRDNRPNNLELWVRSQPYGQRVSDLLAWAHEIIARYAPSEEVAS